MADIMFFIVLILIFFVYYLFDWILRSLKISNFTDKYVFITGCDSGFGREFAIRLDSLGFHVFAGCLTENGAKSLSENASSRVITVLVDVSETESIRSALQIVKDKLPANTGLWALVNNAGIAGTWTPNEMYIKQDYLDVLNVNVLGMADMTNHFLPLIRKAKGRIVNTASVAGRLGFVPSAYTISKFAVEGHSDVLRLELAPHGVRVSIVEPGAFKTPIFNLKILFTAARKAYDRSSKEVQEAYGHEKMDRFVEKLSQTANPKTSLVVDAYTHAVTARYPRTRYAVGPDAKFFYIPISFLPAPLSDPIISRLK